MRDRFFLFHRPRQWNVTERCWMGYERKRGKLADLNALLRGKARATASSLIVGDPDTLAACATSSRWTPTPNCHATRRSELVGAIGHPLNRRSVRPAAAARGQRLRDPAAAGRHQPAEYGALALCPVVGGDAGIDPYTRMVSDVYQDVFGEGSFIGKGIYDVDAFELALAGRFPENRILSHDLLEGCYARAGLLSDVQVYEEYPARYSR